MIAAAAMAGLAAVVGGALLLDRPVPTGGDAAPATPSASGTATLPPSAAPIAGTGPAVTPPIAGQPCDPAVHDSPYHGGEIALRCAGAGAAARWTQVVSAPAAPELAPIENTGPGNSGKENPGNGSSGNGNSGNGATGNQGNGNQGNGKPDKPGKPEKPDR